MSTLFEPAFQLDDDTCYQALLNRDASFDGLFITGVKTTGIFCRPICTARKPKRENVEFFASTKEAIAKGYRPCKVCQPLDKPDETPAVVREILQAFDQDPSLKLKDQDLRSRGIEPSTIRRWFLRHHGITFQAFQRMHRINAAFNRIQEGDKISSAAFDAGYESISGFSDSFRSVFGFAPSQSRDEAAMQVTRIDTPLGTMMACAVREGICLLEFTERKMLETELKALARRMNATPVQGTNEHFGPLRQQLDEYFAGRLREFTVPLVSTGTAFQRQAWEALRQIPYGTTVSYQSQAASLGNAQAVRAVATANGMNRIAIIIPCHRVIGADGQLTGYAGGLWRKQWLLDHERKHKPAAQASTPSPS